ncbi:MAG: S-layer homology domain-containing protein, partial [Synergistaceae bacterium]|nr:S-layer homology domain-containing protein [Synergistaceae bacterium]
FAANPFADVPTGHWAYDAVAQLAARGKLVGYPDGSFKGPQAATRYEMAAVVARMLANIDMEKASKQDLEMLKKLVVEFKSELDALGVKVDKLDSRVALLEERIGGWKFSGNFRFTARWSDDGVYVDPDGSSNAWGVDQDSDWSVDRFRWNITKYVDDKVTLNVRLQGGGGNSLDVVRAYATIKFPWDITAQVGRFPLDWEADFYATDFAGYNMNNAYVTDYDPMATAVWFQKPFEMGSFEMFVAHDENDNAGDYYRYGARLAFDVNENLHVAANYVKYDFDSGHPDFSTLWGDLIVNFNENIAFKAQYFTQDADYGIDMGNAWKAIIDVKQDALKFTDLWIEYAQIDEGFLFANADPYAWAAKASLFGAVGIVTGHQYAPVDTDVLNIVAKQRWNDQWWTYVRYINVDTDVPFFDYSGYTASVRYNYTPNLWFEVGYDMIDSDALDAFKWDDNMVWFRTTVNF